MSKAELRPLLSQDHVSPEEVIDVTAAKGTLASFSFDLWLQPLATSFDPEILQIPVLRHFARGKGFRLDMEPRREELVLFLGSGRTDGAGKMLRGSHTEVRVVFTENARKDIWSRVTATVDSTNTEQIATLYIDAKLSKEVNIPRTGQYSEADSRELFLGSTKFCGQLKQFKLYSGVVTPEAMTEALCNEEISRSHLNAMSSFLWNQRSFTDCEVIADDGQRWMVHRSVLAATSPIFRCMLESGMQEGQQEKPLLFVKDAASADLEAFLHFLYTGRLPEVGNELYRWSAAGVLVLADRYDVRSMVNASLKVLEDTLSLENVIDVVRVMNKRKSNKPIGAAYKRVCCRVKDSEELHQRVMDSVG